MEILKWQLIEAELLSAKKVQMQRVLVVTDCSTIEAETKHIGAISLRLDQFQNMKMLETTLTKIGANCDVLVVCGRPQPLYSLTKEQWRIYGCRYLTLLHWVFAQNCQISVLSFYTHADTLSAIFDGMARSASLEMPRVTFTSAQIDITEITLNEWIEKSLLWPNARLQFDGHSLFRQMLVPIRQQDTGATVLQKDDNIIIIGGAGGIGNELCQFLHTTMGFRLNIFVLGRKTPDGLMINSLRNRGVRNYFRVDAANYSVLESVFSHIVHTSGPIKAVFNLAGVLDDCLFHNLTEERMENVLRPKVGVTSNLAMLAQDYQLQYVVNFSSLTAIIGNIGQSAYAAANECVERISRQLSGWYCFSWGLWHAQGMQMEQGTSGLQAIDPQVACAHMMSAIADGERHLVIFDGENEGVAALRSDGVTRESYTSMTTPKTVQPVNIDKCELRERTQQWLTDIIRRHSGLKSVHETDNLLDKGIDSIGSIQISTDISAQLSAKGDFKLSRAILFEYSTIAQLSDHLIQQAELLLWMLLEPTVTENVVVNALQKQIHTDLEGGGLSEKKAATTVSTSTAFRSLASAYRDDDIAIIGVAGEFPNGATLEEFWSSLQLGTDAVTIIPEQRWNWRVDYSATSARSGKTYGRHGGFIEDAYEFDPSFFNIAPVDAELLDPQERRFLQVSYHALEDAGYFIEPTSEVGVFVAAMFGHYQDLNVAERVINSSFAAIANRVSYSLDLQGPSMTVDTMCSGSLTALHLACNSLKLGECKIALAGGVNIMSHPGKYRLLSQGQFLSTSGYCHAFGIEADGYVPGEGCAVVVLKPLAEAIRTQDNIYAIIRATAINTGGKTSSFTVPSGRAQQRVIQAALAKADIKPDDVNYIEAHGTGTSLGDPIELQALQAAYGDGKDVTCYLGSVKSNIGHLESTAAMAGLFKVIQQLACEQLVPTLHCAIENPYLNISKTRFQLVKKSQYWPLTANATTRFAGLSSFGAGGANGHAILQQYIPPHPEIEEPLQDTYLIPLSAPNKSSLQRVRKQLIDYLKLYPDTSLYALSYTLCCAKQHHSERECFLVHNMEDLLSALRSQSAFSISSDNRLFAYEKIANEYLQGHLRNFQEMFSVKKKIRFPHYPFAKNSYCAQSLKYANGSLNHVEPTERTVDIKNHADLDSNVAVLLKPIWQKKDIVPSSVVPELIVIMSPEKPQITHIGTAKVLWVGPGEHLQISNTQILLRLHSQEDFIQTLKYLTEELGQEQIYWVNFNVQWTAVSALALAKALQFCQCCCSLLCINDANQTPEDIAMDSVFRVLALENSTIDFAQIFIEGGLFTNPDTDWKWISAELSAIRRDIKEIKLQNQQRWVRDLELVELTEERRLRNGGIYLIAGGMGMIGKEIAGHLYTYYQAKAVLVGRSSLSAENQTWLQHWQSETQGEHYGEICYIQADITNLAEVEQLVANILGRFNGLNGIIQSAGILHDAQVQNKSLADFESVMKVKVVGTRNLDRCTADLSLDFFCL